MLKENPKILLANYSIVGCPCGTEGLSEVGNRCRIHRRSKRGRRRLLTFDPRRLPNRVVVKVPLEVPDRLGKKIR